MGRKVGLLYIYMFKLLYYYASTLPPTGSNVGFTTVVTIRGNKTTYVSGVVLIGPMMCMGMPNA